jgi:glycosyltransferase involved in cell wall biosynthesis
MNPVEAGVRALVLEPGDDAVVRANAAARSLEPGQHLLLLRAGAEPAPGAVAAMVEALEAGERHAAVVARSDEAGPGLIPRELRDPAAPAGPERSRRVFDEIAAELPPFSITPSATDLALLVRHDVVRRHGLFDESFATTAGAVADLVARLARLGHSTVVAHHAFVAGAATSTYPAAQAADQELLHARYPYLPELDRRFAELEVDALDHFAELLVERPGARRSLLVDVDHLTLQYDGTARNAVSFLAALAGSGIGSDIDISVQASERIAEFFDLARYGFPVVRSEQTGIVYDLALSLSPLAHSDAILTLNRKAAQWVLLHLDVIALRSLELRAASWARRRVVQDSFSFADRIVSISRSSISDAGAFFPGRDLEAERTVVVPQGATVAPFPAGDRDVEWSDLDDSTRRVVKLGGYLLVMGNWYPHKQVGPALAALSPGRHPIVTLGLSSHDAVDSERVHGLPAGRLSDPLLNRLIRDCSVMIYPSSYEGFGLPLVEGVAAGKRVVAFRSDAVVETVRELGLDEYVDFFDDFDDLPEVVEGALTGDRPTAALRAGIRSSEPFNQGIIDVVLDQIGRPVDRNRLRRRWNHFVAVTEYLGDAENARTELRVQRDEVERLEELNRRHDELSRDHAALSSRHSELDILLERIQARRSYRLTERLVALPPVRSVIGRFRRLR